MSRSKFFLFIRMVVVLLPFCASAHHTDIPALWASYAKTENITKKLNYLYQIADIACKTDDKKTQDSALDAAIEIATITGNDTLSLHAFRQYFSLTECTHQNAGKSREYANNMLALAKVHNDNEWYYHAYSAQSAVSMAENNNKLAIDNISKAYYYIGLTNNDTFKTECFLQWGKCLELTNNKLDAFRNYLNALTIAQKQQNHQEISNCYDHLSYFYLLIGNYPQARDYKIKQIALLPKLGITDSLSINRLYRDLAEKYYYNKEPHNAEKITYRLINYAKAHNDTVLLKQVIDNHSTYLIQNGMFNELADFYTKKFPEELAVMHNKDSISYYRVMAYVYENKKMKDSSLLMYAKADAMVLAKVANVKFYLSNFEKRYAQFLLRNGQRQLATQKMELAYNAAKDVGYLPYLIETSQYLDSLYYAAGNTAKAYTYTKLNKKYTDEQQAVTKQDALLQMEIDNETKQRQIIAEHEQKQTERRHNLQYMGIIIGIVFCFIVLTMLGSFTVPKIIIKSLGFFSFIFFFEFIILLADHKIMEITHHEPWKMLGIKVLIISFLLPFHHWLEHKVIHYLIEHKLIDTQRFSLRKLFVKKASTPPTQ
ncbi:hypothetical protein CAP35_10935 [Chitinophagaceae bacterium IBVUCB1]|nr:hypothetical protein CAP35_10935 [Chitinophagaceae bacterium IBVUCB1]